MDNSRYNYYNETRTNVLIDNTKTKDIDDAIDWDYLNFEKEINDLIESDLVASGEETNAEIMFREIYSQNKETALQWILTYSRKSYTHEKRIIAILHIISHFQYYELNDGIYIIAVAALAHHDKVVKKFAIKCFDNWDNENLLTYLFGIDWDGIGWNNKWLKDYAKKIISRLEKRL